MSNWDKEQEEAGIALIERTYKVKLPSGRKTKVNRFDYNLAMMAAPDKYIQCTDLGWIRASSLKII